MPFGYRASQRIALTLAWWRKDGDAFRATHAEQQQPKQGRTARLRRMAAQVEPPSAPTGRKTARGKGAKIGQAQAPAAPAQQLDLVEALAVLKNGSPPPAAK